MKIGISIHTKRAGFLQHAITSTCHGASTRFLTVQTGRYATVQANHSIKKQDGVGRYPAANELVKQHFATLQGLFHPKARVKYSTFVHTSCEQQVCGEGNTATANARHLPVACAVISLHRSSRDIIEPWCGGKSSFVHHTCV